MGADNAATGWRIEGSGFASVYPKNVVPGGPASRGELTHMGEDWNKGSGNDDYQEPVFAVANGTVEYVGSPAGWDGQVIVLRHDLPPGVLAPTGGSTVYSVYAHLEGASVAAGQSVQIGDQIARLGDPDGFSSHLHFEMRDQWSGAMDDGYALNAAGDQTSPGRGWFDPSVFIAANRADAIADDFAADGRTTAKIEIGQEGRDQIWGVLEERPEGQFDSDWIAVDLEAGKTYTFAMRGSDTRRDTQGSPDLADPSLRLRDPSGQQITWDGAPWVSGLQTAESGAGGRDVRVSFTAAETGTYHLVAFSTTNTTGSYRISAIEVEEEAPPAEPLPTIDAVMDLVSVATDGTLGRDGHSHATLSNDGRFVAFESKSGNLVSGHADRLNDVFVHDRQSGTTELVTVGYDGSASDNNSYNAMISGNGRHVVYRSAASNHVEGDTERVDGTFVYDIFVRDLETGITSVVTRHSDGSHANGSSYGAHISDDGRYVAFLSSATNLVDGDTNGVDDVFVRDLLLGATTRVSVNADGIEGNGASGSPYISADGNLVSFRSQADNFGPWDGSGFSDTYVYDRGTQNLSRVDYSYLQTTYENGSYSRNYFPADPDVLGFGRSADGRFEVTATFEDPPSGSTVNAYQGVFVTDLQSGETRRVSENITGEQADNTSIRPFISADGTVIAFQSIATNLIDGFTGNSYTSAVYVASNPFLDTPANSAPVWNYDGAFAGETDAGLAVPFISGFGDEIDFRLSDYVYDADGDDVTFSINIEDYGLLQQELLPSGLSFDPATSRISGTMTATDTDGFGDYVPNQTLSFTMDDGNGNVVDITRDWIVTSGANQAPVFKPYYASIGNLIVAEIGEDGGYYDFLGRWQKGNFHTRLGLDFVDPDEGDRASVSVKGLPDGLRFSWGEQRIYGDLPDQVGTHVFTVTATDRFGASTAMDYVLEIRDDVANSGAIAITSNPKLEVYEGQIIEQGDIRGPIHWFIDPDDDVLTYTGWDLPDGLQIDPYSGEIYGTVASSAGLYAAHMAAFDNGPMIDPDGTHPAVTIDVEFSVLAAPPNRAPLEDLGDGLLSFGFLRGQELDNRRDYNLGNWFTDPDGDDLTFTETGLPDGLILNYHTGELFGTVTGEAQTYDVTIFASDGELGGVNAIDIEVRVGDQPAIDTLDLEYAARVVAYSRNGVGVDYPGLQMTYKIGEAITSANGFVAVPITSDYGDSILAVRGTASLKDVFADLQPGSIGKNQVDQAWGDIAAWLADNPDAHITGHSLGGAQAQYIAVRAAQDDLSVAQVATFNSPGIGQEYVDIYNDLPSTQTTYNISHFVAKGDLVSMAGDAYLPGQVNLYSFAHAGPNPFAQLLAAHTTQWAQPDLVGTDGYDWSLDFFDTAYIPYGALNSAKYSHLYAGEGSSLGFSPEYFNLMLMVARIDVVRILSGSFTKKDFITDSSVDLIKYALSDAYSDPTAPVPAGPLLSMKMMTRGNVEEMREAIGFKAFEFLEYVELTKSALATLSSAAAAVRVWSADMYDRVATWTAETWDGVSSMVADAWDAAIEWGADAWDAIAGWTIETWEKTANFTAQAWQATATWTAETWNAAADWTAETWDKVSDMTAGTVNILKQLSPAKVASFMADFLESDRTDADTESTNDDNLLYSQGSLKPVVGLGGRDALLGGTQDDYLFGDDFELAYDADASAQVFRLYQATLDRAPDTVGHKAWTSMILTNEIQPIQAVSGFVNSREFKATYGGLDDTQFVEQLYSNVLDRPADAGGLAAWSGGLQSGSLTREDVVLGFSDSREFVVNTKAASTTLARDSNPAEWSDDIYRLYRATLDRDPDEVGFVQWANSLGDGADFTAVISGFVNSREFQNTYGDLGDAEFVELLYGNVLGRAADAAGLAAWTAQLDAGTSRAQVVKGFAQSIEFTAKTQANLLNWVRSLGENDYISGGAGKNVMAGGLLADTFEFMAGEDATFEVLDLERWDTLDFTDFDFAVSGDVRDHLTQAARDVVFDHKDTVVVLKNMDLSDLADDMFLV